MAISLSSLKRGKENKPPRIILYGDNGIGKTTFAAGAPNPVMIQTEDGIGELEIPRFPLAKTYDEVKASLETLVNENHDFQTVEIDSMDWMERLIFKKVCEDKGKDSIEEIGYAKGYTFALKYWDEIIDLLDRLRDEKQMIILLLGHVQTKRFDPPDGDSYDRYRFDMHDKSSSVLLDWADCVLFAKYKVFTKKSGDGFNQRSQAVAPPGEDRFLYTQERPSHWAKNRYSLPYEIPFRKEDSWKTFMDALINSSTLKN